VKTKLSSSLVGLFVLGAIALGIVAVVSFGGVSVFTRPQRFEVFFDESIQGLDLGSQVKLRGDRLGRVVGIRVRYDAVKKHSEIEVTCELTRDTLTDARGQMIDIADNDQLKKLIDAGLRAQLGINGIATGLLFVELDFVDPTENPIVPPDFTDAAYTVIPTIKSTVSEVAAGLNVILAKLKQVDIVALSTQAQGLIEDTRRQLNSVELRPLVEQWTEAGQNVRQLAASPDWQATLTNLNGAVSDLRGVIAKIDAQVAPTAANLNDSISQIKAAVDTFNTTVQSLHQFIAAQQGLGADADLALRRLAETLDSVRRLAEYLEANPAALIAGRKPGDDPALTSPSADNPPTNRK
jgi:paraquat-inducible protein B